MFVEEELNDGQFEGEGGHGEVGAAKSESRNSDHQADDGPDAAGGQRGQGRVPPPVERDPASGGTTNAREGHLAEAELARPPREDPERHHDDREEIDQRHPHDDGGVEPADDGEEHEPSGPGDPQRKPDRQDARKPSEQALYRPGVADGLPGCRIALGPSAIGSPGEETQDDDDTGDGRHLGLGVEGLAVPHDAFLQDAERQ